MRFKQYLQESTQFFTTDDEVRAWCMANLMPMTWEIHDDLTVESHANIYLIGKDKIPGVTNLPVQFRDCKYHFVIQNRDLTNLVGTPRHVEKTFDCSMNRLESLEGCPQNTGDFICSKNPLKSLKGSPTELYGNINAQDTHIFDLRGIEEHLSISTAGGRRSLAMTWDHIHNGGLGLLNIEGLEAITNYQEHSKQNQNGTWFVRSLPKPFEIIQKYLELDFKDRDIFACQSELIEAGFDTIAEL